MVLVCVGCTSAWKASQPAPSTQENRFQGVFGTYDAEPRQADGRVDVDRLVRELVAIKANTYNFLVWHGTNDWEDLQLFLPEARKHDIRVWVTLVPPSESPPHAQNFSEPFRLDYQRWAVEIAKLSVREPNLVAWSLDDFVYNEDTFTPEYMRTMMARVHAINPKLAFIPCIYFGQVTARLAGKYRPFMDGILFPYRHDLGKRNLSEWDTLEAEVARIREQFGAGVPVFVDVYATKHSQLNNSTADYVKHVMEIAHRCADGVMIFCHQYEATSPEKYHVIKTLFWKWSAEDAVR